MMFHSSAPQSRAKPQGEFSLNYACKGDSLRIVSIGSNTIDRAGSVRLMELGLVPGVDLELISKSHGLVRIRIRGADISIRNDSAEAIRVQLSPSI